MATTLPQLPALGARQTGASALTGQQPAKTGGNASSAADALMQRTAQDVVALSKKGLDLSAQGLAQRTDALGNATLDVAQDFLGNMARQLFGDGASINFDSIDLSAASGYAAQVSSSSGAGGTRNAAAFSLAENAHFIGKGTITTADGQSFDFELEVQYESKISASAAYETSNEAEVADTGEDGGLPTLQLPSMNFAGSLGDLFRMLGQQLQSSIYDASQDSADQAKAKAGDEVGSLRLRLLNLLQPPKTVDEAAKPVEVPTTAAPELTPEAQARARAVAEAYGGKPTASD
ncbi:hypothetical protein [Janthinobacterium psychrotolerans]|uniref:DUF5610 domain-containing protein n=1 Tax=Janthinobacterium psychrotolerans TaxID=1747903 RepID=A0A1A7C2Z2_9BURK|nr:hypothetical protein [Janthinobacterium psychrotolerans]OBV38683.1 hypothetical protein ASR47_1006288 [Janthinobacterium psychrotolerans]